MPKKSIFFQIATIISSTFLDFFAKKVEKMLDFIGTFCEKNLLCGNFWDQKSSFIIGKKDENLLVVIGAF